MRFRPRHRQWLIAEAFTLALLLLVAFASGGAVTYLFVLIVAIVLASAGCLYWLFPGSRLFTIGFANGLAVYACLYANFLNVNFLPLTVWAGYTAFPLPVLAFLAAAVVHRDRIRHIIAPERLREERHFGHVLYWLIPVFAIGASTFVLPELGTSATVNSIVLLADMAAIAAIVAVVAPTVATFLIDTGLLFEEFFERTRRLLVPAFAFLTFYTLQVIVFGAIYRLIDQFSSSDHFAVAGVARTLDFQESLYFSIVTLSTVGYGDIVPLTDTVRVVVSVQIVMGVLLLLFGFSEIMLYARSHPEPRHRGPHGPMGGGTTRD